MIGERKKLAKVAMGGALLLFSQAVFGNYKQAREFFAKKDYSRAAAEYYQVYEESDSKADKRKAEWGLAQSLQKLGLNYSASKYYS